MPDLTLHRLGVAGSCYSPGGTAENTGWMWPDFVLLGHCVHELQRVNSSCPCQHRHRPRLVRSQNQVSSIAAAPHFNISIIGAFLRSQLGNLSRLVSIGKVRMRLAVAAKIAFVTAGATTAVGASPKPPGASELLTR
jgi:hypothetical protein